MIELRVATEWHALAMRMQAAEKQIPFAMALALTRSAQQAQRDMRGAMASAFDRPTRFTLNATFVRAATKQRLQADIHFRDFAPKGVPAGKYLRPQILGAARRAKAGERRIGDALGLAAPFLAPTGHIGRDAHGNVARGQMVAILARLRALGDASTTGTSRGRRRSEGYFAVLPGRPQGRGGRGGGLPPAIYKTTGKGSDRIVLPVLTVLKGAPSYSIRLDFEGVARTSYARNATALFEAALAHALATAR